MEILRFPTSRSREFTPTNAMIMTLRHGPKEGRNGPLSRRGIALTRQVAQEMAEAYIETNVEVQISSGDISRVVQTADIFEQEFHHFMPFRQRVRRFPNRPELSAHAILYDFKQAGLLDVMREHVASLEGSPWYKFRKTHVDDEAMGKALLAWMEKGEESLPGTVPFPEVRRIHAYWLHEAMGRIREGYISGREIMDIRVSHEIQAFVLGTFACRYTRSGKEDGLSIMRRRKGKTPLLSGPQFKLFANDYGETKFKVLIGKTWYEVDEALVAELANEVSPISFESTHSLEHAGDSNLTRRKMKIGYPLESTERDAAIAA